MTNAISLNADIFHDAEQTAHRLLSSLAVTEFSQTHSQGAPYPAKLDDDLVQMQYDMFDMEDW
ncbi:MAG: hypothetical protein LBS97_07645 [Treponema sp.]|jgi:hypothetical protein|nr:hypothetical protein [Treponema sp.]